MPKFKVPFQKEILQVGEVLVLLTGNKACHRKGISSEVYALVSMHHEKVSCMIIFNGDRHLAREIEDRLVPGIDGIYPFSITTK